MATWNVTHDSSMLGIRCFRQKKQPLMNRPTTASLQVFEDRGALPPHSLEKAFGDAAISDGGTAGSATGEKPSLETASFLLAYWRVRPDLEPIDISRCGNPLRVGLSKNGAL